MDMTSPQENAHASLSLEDDPNGVVEIELKLTTNSKNLSKLLNQLSASSEAVKSSRKITRIVSTYFDTPDRRLRNRGLTLRVRQKNGKRVQTVKSAGTESSGMFARQEWTTPLEGKKPDLNPIESSSVRNRMGLILPQELSPLFKTDVKRTSLIIDHTTPLGKTAQIELAFDQGRIVAGKKTDEISELELELVSGSPKALLDLAKVISGIAPTVLNLHSKVSRGFDLSYGTHPQAVMAPKIKLPTTASVEEAIVEILKSSQGHLLANRSAAALGQDIEGVHQARVAIRRIRSALSVFKDYLTCPDAEKIKNETRWLINVLGEARDLDVFIDEVLPAVKKDRPDDKDLSAVLLAAQKARTTAYRKVKSALTSRRYTDAMLATATWIENRAWREQDRTHALDAPIKDVSCTLLAKRHRKVMKLGKNFKTLSTDQRHEVRIALKKVRYTAEFFSSLYPTALTRPYISAMRGLQNALGALNDVATAETLTATLVATAKSGTKQSEALRMGAGKVLGWHTRAATDANENVVELWTAFAKSQPFWLPA